MAEIVNLRQARKARARAEAEAQAATNRARFGRAKADRKVAEDAERRRNALLDGARRED